MKTIRKLGRKVPIGIGANRDFVDLKTIRSRVATIKNNWSPETARARALEGIRRRDALESMVLDALTDTSDSEESCDINGLGLSLVG